MNTTHANPENEPGNNPASAEPMKSLRTGLRVLLEFERNQRDFSGLPSGGFRHHVGCDVFLGDSRRVVGPGVF